MQNVQTIPICRDDAAADVSPVKALMDEPVGFLVGSGMKVGESLQDCPVVLGDGKVLGLSVSCSSSTDGALDSDNSMFDGICDGSMEGFPLSTLSIVGIMVGGAVLLNSVGDSDKVGKDDGELMALVGCIEGAAVGASDGDSDGRFQGDMLGLWLG